MNTSFFPDEVSVILMKQSSQVHFYFLISSAMLALNLLLIGMGNFKLSIPNDNRFVEQKLVAGMKRAAL
jgi:hypothetical protein